jgi:hypothetical protein
MNDESGMNSDLPRAIEATIASESVGAWETQKKAVVGILTVPSKPGDGDRSDESRRPGERPRNPCGAKRESDRKRSKSSDRA